VDALTLPARLDRLRAEGTLLEMSRRGSGPEFRGFANAAAHLVQECERRKA
jgi:hypothetical protein